MKKKKNEKASEAPILTVGAPAANLATGPASIQPVTTLGVQPSFLGSPIMRDDFITRTGFTPTK